jgi:uncharacterized membrane protein YidH (DUF202 family)
MKRLMTLLTFAGGLLALGNYLTDGWAAYARGRPLYAASNAVSICLLTVAAVAAGTTLLRDRTAKTLIQDERRELVASLVLSVAALVVLLSWMLVRAIASP